MVLKIFTAEFYSIGALFACYGVGMIVVGGVRRREGNRMVFEVEGREMEGEERDGRQEGRGVGERRKVKTCGNVVLGVTVLTVGAYVVLLWLVVRLGRER